MGTPDKPKIDDYVDITAHKQPPNPRHRPPDKIWLRHMQLALAVEELRQAGCAYKEAVAKVAEKHHASESTVARSYSKYISEPADPNTTAQRRKWRNCRPG